MIIATMAGIWIYKGDEFPEAFRMVFAVWMALLAALAVISLTAFSLKRKKEREEEKQNAPEEAQNWDWERMSEEEKKETIERVRHAIRKDEEGGQ